MSLQTFRQRHGLSYQQLSDICEGSPNCSKNSIVRLLKGEIDNAAMESEIRQVLADKLPDFLLTRGLNASQIDAELTAIFTSEEYQTMIEDKVSLNKTTQQWFGLADDPFDKLPRNRQEVFVSPGLQAVFDTVIDAIKYRKFIYISGEIGAGKLVLRMMVEDYIANNPAFLVISPETFDMSKLTSSAITRKMLESLGETSIPRSPVAQTDKLKDLFQRNTHRHIALLFDEIHRVHTKLNRETIPALKNYWEMLRHGFSRDLGIILIGQPSFETTLNEMPEMKKRIEVVKMPDFQSSAIDYLKHRFAVVGVSDVSKLFDDEALAIIQHNSTTPLTLGNVANKALQTAKSYADKFVCGSLLTIGDGFAQMPEVKELGKVRKTA